MTPSNIVQAAYKYLAEVTKGQKISEVRVEELEPAVEGKKKFWNVVLSYDAVGDFPFEKKREYKEFRIDDENGLVVSMKIKKV